MTVQPTPEDWHLNSVIGRYPGRISNLQSAPAFETIVEMLTNAFVQSIYRNECRFATDKRDDWRAVVQFPVLPQLYDLFFNARTGYRAQYWISPENGESKNAHCIARIKRHLWGLPDHFDAREIVYERGMPEQDVGSRSVSRDFFQQSFDNQSAKIWICERHIRGVEGFHTDTPIEGAGRLGVKRWAAQAPLPPPHYGTWLDLKGGYLTGDQGKNRWLRARAIHYTGYT